MRQWTWVVMAASLGLATACKDAVETERGRLGEEARPEQEAPLEGKGTLGGENLADQEFYGTITALDGNGFTARDDSGQELPFRVQQGTSFMRDGQPVGLGQLREGSQIRTTYDELEGQYVADQVEIYPGTPSREPSAAPEAAPDTRK
jgi:hypothetical protein